MKEIIIVTTHTGGGGMGRYICSLTDSLASRNWKVKLYCLKHQNNRFSGNPNIKVHAFKIINHLPRFIKYYMFAKRLLHYTQNSKTPIISTMRIFNPTMMIVGGVHATHVISRNKKKSIYDKLEIYLEKISYTNAKHIIAHSPLMIDEIGYYQLDVANKIHMIYPPVSTKTFKYATPEEKIKIRQKLNLPKDKFIIVAAGTCDPRKGVPLAVQAIKILPENEFYLMIFGAHYKGELPQNAKHFGEVDNLQDYFSAANCTLVPSKYEPFGLVVVESLQSGTPVITSQEVGAKDLIGPKEGIILAERSPEAIANALMKMTTHSYKVEPNFVNRSGLSWDSHTEKIEYMLL